MRAALAFLLLNAGRPVSIHRMVDALWGETAPRTARAQVHTVISTLRKALPSESAGLLSFDTAGYRFAVPDGDVDAAAFSALLTGAKSLAERGDQVAAADHLRRALALWRGEALSGIEAPFAEPARLRLEEERFAAHGLLADLDLAAGRHRALVPELTALLRAYPAREDIAVRLATALHRCDRQADALAVVRETRAFLLREFGLDPGDGLVALETALLSGRFEAPSEEPSAKAVRREAGPGKVRPAQLPQTPHGFVGRTAEFGRLTALARGGSGDARIALVTGPAGVGKTSVAVHWAQSVADDFTDGQLFVDLHGYDEGECEPAARVLERFLLALGVPGHRIPEDPVLREDLYRSTVAGRKLLVVLDNARDYEQVRPLLPGSAQGFTVVTSRVRLGGLVARTGAAPVPLGVLPAAEAIEVLARLAGRERVRAAPEAAAELAQLCGGLPLALRISAVRLLDEPEAPLSGLTVELAPESDRLAGLSLPGDELTVSGALEHSYRRLPTDQARFFRLLALHPGAAIPAAAAGALWGAPETPLSAALPPEARALLRSLESVHLVERVADDQGRHRMHDLVRLYGRQIAASSKAEGTAALGRLFDWYIAHADAAHALLDPRRFRPPTELDHSWSGPPPFEGEAEAQDWYARESENLAALTRLGAAVGEHRAVWQLAVLHLPYLLRSHRLGLLAELQRIGESSAAALGHDSAAATLANNQGIAYAIRRDRQAKEHFDRAIALYGRVGDVTGVVRARLNIGNLHYEFRELAEAAGYQEQAVEAGRASGKKDLLAVALANLALVRTDQGRHATARDLLTEAVAIHEAGGSDHAAAVAHGQLAWVLQRLGVFQEAFELSDRSLAVARRFDDRLLAGRMLDQMGMARAAQGRVPQARAYWEQAMETFTEIGSVEAETVRARLIEHCC
ncbi:BTAD domain-containing putative transcriptional regulator [Kitasatospora sp. NRRL B-11411]|uniref:AfsR/SARP family transcriptional regulator n=1 Tax=Kitasatospora sp. NRRL B-11411 TaxID=1463822 RepID=UPI0009DD52DC|nr:BTAD domain-containing putative transcriptional regulator [Kitasatospora sp. NRRL B-11411]